MVTRIYDPFLGSRAKSEIVTLGRADAKDTLWPGHFHRYRGGRAPDFEERWQNHTELSLRSASPGGADTVEAACGPVAGAVAESS